MNMQLEVKDRVQRQLVDIIGNVQVDKDGDFSFRYESTRLYISVRPYADNSATVEIFTLTNIHVPRTPELFKYVATRDYLYGAFRVNDEPDGTVSVLVTHTLLGDTIDADELKIALFNMMVAADEVDDEIKNKFGGERFYED